MTGKPRQWLVNNPDVREAVLDGSYSARELAERFNCAERTIVRIRARYRRDGQRVRVPVFGDPYEMNS